MVTNPFELMSPPDNLIFTFEAAIMMLHVFCLIKCVIKLLLCWCIDLVHRWC
jgi:hypothetical protein